MKIDAIDTIYFIGIGGIGMSALARYMNSLNKKVYGYDKTGTKLTKKLVSEGIEITYDDDPEQLPENVDLVVYTPAVPKTHKGLLHFQNNGFDVIKRAELLGRISREKSAIAIAGTHGKTTTSAMTAFLLKYGGIDISAFVGGIMTNFNSNYIAGEGEWVVLEADEYDRSFLHLNPQISALISVDADHLDIYGKADKMQEGFEAFIAKIKDGGIVILKKEIKLQLSKELLKSLESKAVDVITFGYEDAEILLSNITTREGKFVFDYSYGDKYLKGLETNMAGRHNIENAVIGITIALELGVAEDNIRKGLNAFKGIKRRFEKIAEKDGKVYIDDYAHHPTELNAAIQAARELYPTKKITGIFQPHLYSRTRDFADGFAEALSRLDQVILMDIYPAREEPIEGVSSDMVFEEIAVEHKYRASKQNVMEVLSGLEFEVLLTLGAGDIDLFIDPIKEKFFE